MRERESQRQLLKWVSICNVSSVTLYVDKDSRESEILFFFSLLNSITTLTMEKMSLLSLVWRVFHLSSLAKNSLSGLFGKWETACQCGFGIFSLDWNRKKNIGMGPFSQKKNKINPILYAVWLNKYNQICVFCFFFFC